MREKLPPLLLSLSASYLFGLGVALWAFDLSPWLNFSIGFFGSLLVMVATFLSHYRRVLEASKQEELVALEEAKIKRREDPYDLFEEEEESPLPLENEEISREKLKEWAPPKRRFSLEGFWMGTRLSLSLYRLLAYLIFVAGIFFLIRHEILNPFSLALGVFCVTLGLVGGALLGASDKKLF